MPMKKMCFTMKYKEQSMIEYQTKEEIFLKIWNFFLIKEKKVLNNFIGQIFPMKVMGDNAREK